MELTELKNKIINSFNGSKSDLLDILTMIDKDEAVFPFNEYEHLICALIDKGNMTYDQYLQIRAEYISENPNIWIFEISAPRGFGEKFAQTYIQGKCSKLKKPSRKTGLNYSNQYDLFLDGIRIEVKASRAVDSDSNEPLYMKALSRHTKKRFFLKRHNRRHAPHVQRSRKLFAGRIQPLMNSLNEPMNLRGKFSGF